MHLSLTLRDMFEEDLNRMIEARLNMSLADIAYTALRKVALLGLPIKPQKTSNRTVVVFYEKRRAVFRVTVARGLGSSHVVCLRTYVSDCGRVATISGDGQINFEIDGIPGYLSSPGELFNGFVADVWTARVKAVQRGEVVPVSRERLPAHLLSRVGEKVGPLLDRLEVYYMPATSDYALGKNGVYPVWTDMNGLVISVSEIGLEELRELFEKEELGHR
jgi:hypothetical protein